MREGILRIALAQINCFVGDIESNIKKITNNIRKAKEYGADIVCFPELCITGYPPEDLLLKPGFINANLKALNEVKKASSSIISIVGFVQKDDDIYNSAAIIQNRKILGIYRKTYLPNYGVFDENRYFQSDQTAQVFKKDDLTFGVNICEDIWYPGDPTKKQVVLGGAQVIINLSSSPYYSNKPEMREQMLRNRAKDYTTAIAFCNLVGGQDELVFDGRSVCIDENGAIISRAKSFKEDLLVTDIDLKKVFRARLKDPKRRKSKARSINQSIKEIDISSFPKRKKKSINNRIEKPVDLRKEVLDALVLGARDYIKKNGFKKVVVGLSGGIDSAFVATIAVEAIGKKNVIGVTMPSKYSSKGSVRDSELLVENLGIELLNIPIIETYNEYLKMLKPAFKGKKRGTAEENIQARIRGNILMALSNKFGWLVLTTGNKSEMSVGYATLYGDMAGGFAVIKDVPKTKVYELAQYYNETKKKQVIPKSILTKAPSAELSPGQKDTDFLPPYDELDRILKLYIEEDLGVADIVATGENRKVVEKVVKMVDLNEYKRRQSPPGIKITTKAFGKDRRFPITNGYNP